jgi:hypothetical protein
MGDYIKNLPVDTSVSTVNEMKIINTLFTAQKGNMLKIVSGTKDIILAGVLFFLISLPFVDNLLGKSVNFVKNSNIIMLLVKTILFMVLFFVLQNYFLARKVD